MFKVEIGAYLQTSKAAHLKNKATSCAYFKFMGSLIKYINADIMILHVNENSVDEIFRKQIRLFYIINVRNFA
ncbi:hypothetical protein GCM10008119_33930 [Pedobacter mendelii]|uniref:Uncharacterized protein n=1 Tax=Pedobacter mendelii TaxID=1908240 RepID=A0ABQ2BN91_9SPHI|nr:hypothetical protein GCM10008119_33930 [Pedobacter mendelii]